MKLTIVALASAIAVAGLGYSSTQAFAGSVTDDAVATTQQLSAKKKHKRVRVHVHPRHDSWRETYHAPRWGFGVGADPSILPPGYGYGLARARATGRCVEDLGYGRYAYCGW